MIASIIIVSASQYLRRALMLTDLKAPADAVKAAEQVKSLSTPQAEYRLAINLNAVLKYQLEKRLLSRNDCPFHFNIKLVVPSANHSFLYEIGCTISQS